MLSVPSVTILTARRRRTIARHTSSSARLFLMRDHCALWALRPAPESNGSGVPEDPPRHRLTRDPPRRCRVPSPVRPLARFVRVPPLILRASSRTSLAGDQTTAELESQHETRLTGNGFHEAPVVDLGKRGCGVLAGLQAAHSSSAALGWSSPARSTRCRHRAWYFGKNGVPRTKHPDSCLALTRNRLVDTRSSQRFDGTVIATPLCDDEPPERNRSLRGSCRMPLMRLAHNDRAARQRRRMHPCA